MLKLRYWSFTRSPTTALSARSIQLRKNTAPSSQCLHDAPELHARRADRADARVRRKRFPAPITESLQPLGGFLAAEPERGLVRVHLPALRHDPTTKTP